MLKFRVDLKEIVEEFEYSDTVYLSLYCDGAYRVGPSIADYGDGRLILSQTLDMGDWEEFIGDGGLED